MRSKTRAIVVLVCYSLINCYKFFTICLPSVSKKLIQDDLGLNDFESGLMFTVYTIFSMVVCPFVGAIADKIFNYRKYLSSASIILISGAIMGTSFCKSFGSIMVPRILCGIGVGAFTTLGTPILSDYFSPERRSMVMSVYSAASSLGTAVGFSVGGILSEKYGWRQTFFVLGFPGFAAIILSLFKSPKRRVLLPTASTEEVIDPFTAPDLSASYNSYSSYTSYNFYKSMPPEEEVDVTEKKVEEGGTIAMTSPSKNASRSAIDDPEAVAAADGDDGISSSSHSEETSLFAGEKEKEVYEETLVAPSAAATSEAASSSSGPKYCGVLYQVLTGIPLMCCICFCCVTFSYGALTDWISTFYVREFGLTVSQAGLINGLACIFGVLGTFIGSLFADFLRKRTDRHPYMLCAGIGCVLCAITSAIGFYAHRGIVAVSVIFFGIATIFSFFYIGPINALFLNCFEPQIRSQANGYQFFLRHAIGDSISPSIIGLISDANNGDLAAGLMITPWAFFVGGYSLLLGCFILPPSMQPFSKNKK